jgi:type III secretion protein D
MYELRILNGYHRGATLPLRLDEGEHVIGSADDADVVLADPGVRERHASVALSGSGWTLRVLDGEIRGALDNQTREALQLNPGDAARVGQIWLTVATQDSAWQEPPPTPVDVPAPPEAAADTAATAAPPEQSAPADALHYMDDNPDHPDNAGEGTHATQAAVPPPRAARRSRLVLLAPVALAAVVSAAYAITNRRPGQPDPMARIAAVNAGAEVMPASLQDAAKPAQALSQEQLRAALRKRLTEVDLLNRFDLQLADGHWTMRAVLDDDDAERFRRMLTAFVKQHDIRFPVDVKVGGAEAMLPFRIQQVITGNNASIVTDDGKRLYVGDEYRGVRLAAIGGNQLSFTGKHHLEVTW